MRGWRGLGRRLRTGLAQLTALYSPHLLARRPAHLLPARTCRYDSSFEFDDSIPAEGDSGDFFALYAPVFERNARFSEVKPVPRLGGPGASDEEVRVPPPPPAPLSSLGQASPIPTPTFVHTPTRSAPSTASGTTSARGGTSPD